MFFPFLCQNNSILLSRQIRATRWWIYIPNNSIKLYLRFHPWNTPTKLVWMYSCWVQQLSLKVPYHHPCCPALSFHLPRGCAPVKAQERGADMQKQSSCWKIWEWVGVHRAEGVWFPPLSTHRGPWQIFQPSWGRSLASAALILEQGQCLTLPRGKQFPSWGSWQDTWGAWFHSLWSLRMRCHGAHPVCPLIKSQPHLQHWYSIKFFQFQRGWLLACHQRWVRWLIPWGKSGLHFLALDFHILTLHKHHFFAFIYTQV